jgi:hypothetical protein
MLEALNAGRQAIAEAEKQEPFAWMSNESAYRLKHGGNSKGAVPVHAKKSTASKIPLYTRPQQKQEHGEPVENRFVRELREYGKTNQGSYLFPSWDIHRALKYLDGYTRPQPKREPLTDEQIEAIWDADTTSADDCQSLYYAKVIARAIEAAHGIKEKNT